MKQQILIITILLLLLSCRKDKLNDEKSILQGKWKWVSATETRTLISNGNSAYFVREATEFPDNYFVEIERKGIINFQKNSILETSFRIVFSFFQTDCNELINCNHFSIYLNNKHDKKIEGFVNSDTLTFWCSETNLPLQNRTEGEFKYSYQYFFVKEN